MASVVIVILAVAFVQIPIGKLGDVYPRICSPAQQSLVIGTSRAAQGINPEIINSRLDDIYPSADLYNFSFHIDESTYNEEYVEAVRRKLAPYDGRRHLFIMTVDPWQFKTDLQLTGHLRIRSVTSNPNIEFLLKYFERQWFSLTPSHLYVNEWGRSEVDYEPRSAEQKAANIEAKLRVYSDIAEKYHYGKKSERLMKELARELQRRGDVVLLRMPTSIFMLDIENSVCPNFSARMRGIAAEISCPFLDFSARGYNPALADSVSTGETVVMFDTNDGNHLTCQAGDDFSRALADSLRIVAERVTDCVSVP